MLDIYYDKKGTAFSDFELDSCIEDIKMYRMAETHYVIETSTENIIYAIRSAIYKGELDYNYITFHFSDRVLKMDNKARPANGSLPNTWLDKYLNILIGL